LLPQCESASLRGLAFRGFQRRSHAADTPANDEHGSAVGTATIVPLPLLTALIVRAPGDVNSKKKLCRHRKNLVASRLAQEYGNRVHYYGQDGSLALAQRRIFMVHYSHYAKAMALTGDYDLVLNRQGRGS